MEANPDLCLTVRDSFLGEYHSTPSSLTDTMSPSSDNDLSSLREWGAPTGRNVSSFEVMNTSTTEVSESEAAKEEHFYDGEKNTGYLSWRLRTMSRKNRATRSQQAVPATVPQAQGPNRPRSAPTVPHQLDGDACREALSFLVHSPDEANVKGLSCCSIDEHLRGRKGQQPYILAIGRTRNRIDTFYIVIDKQLIPCQATSSLGSFDELFKSHHVFNLSYEDSLVQLYTFVQTTVYNIDINTTDESPRIRELRAKPLN
ncbi:hypothetical protein NQZ68_031319 [Dissostichus eleginoides]|nr:hypothetical protein NQZ68_031319 [Dissostichus eleginoides]